MANYSAAEILGFAKTAFSPSKPKEKKLSQIWAANIEDHVIGLAYSPDSKLIGAAGIGGQIFLFDAETGEKKYQSEHNFGVQMVSFSRDGKYFTSSGQDGKIKLVDATIGEEIAVLEGGADWVECVRWSPHSDTFVSTAGKKIRLWNAAGELLREYPEQFSTVVDIAWSPAGEKFVTACYGGITQWRAENTIPVQKYKWKGSTLIIAWSPNGKYIATGDQDSTVHFWIAKSGKDMQMYGYPTKVKELSWTYTSRFLATGGGEIVTVWNCEPSPEGTTPMQLKGHENLISVLAFQRQGFILASGGKDAQLILWDVAQNGKRLHSFNFASELTQISWAHGNENFVAASEIGEIRAFAVG